MDKPTLAERLKKLHQDTTDHAILRLFLEDYFKGLDMAMGMCYYATVYGTTFHSYDKNSTVHLAAMIDKAANLEHEKRTELLFHLLVEPYHFLKYIERS